jgi:crotonobetainyl-CoA:carnitine CoA-transferase CaiB-like acyl-CoA transferase
LLDRLESAGVPAGPVNSSRDVLADPTLASRGFWYDIDHPVIGTMPMFRIPIRFGEGRARPPDRPPLLGEHTWEVASTILGMDREEYDRLVADEVLV